jgi:hypothetical protein
MKPEPPPLLMHLKGILSRIRDDLDADGIVVRFEILQDGIRIHARSYADRLIAKHQLIRAGIAVVPTLP